MGHGHNNQISSLPEVPGSGAHYQDMKLRATRFTSIHPESIGPEVGLYLDADYDATRNKLREIAERAKKSANERRTQVHFLRRELRAIRSALLRVLLYDLPPRSGP